MGVDLAMWVEFCPFMCRNSGKMGGVQAGGPLLI